MRPTLTQFLRRNVHSHRRGAAAAAFLGAILFLASDIHAQIQQPGLRNQIPPNQTAEPDKTQPGNSLSEQLNRSDGVIAPPTGIDPKIETPAPEPNPGNMPVIPPPDAPGGPDVQPK
jgi:hypothetical protein